MTVFHVHPEALKKSKCHSKLFSSLFDKEVYFMLYCSYCINFNFITVIKATVTIPGTFNHWFSL